MPDDAPAPADLIRRYLDLRAEARVDDDCPGLALDFAADAARALGDVAAALAASGPVAVGGRVWRLESGRVAARRA